MEELKIYFKNVLKYFKPRIITTILFFILVIVGILQLSSSNLNDNITHLFTKDYKTTFHQHEYYRWFSSSFIHVNVKHFMDTVPLLIIMGFFIEGILGTLPYLFLLLSSCFCSNLLTDYEYMRVSLLVPSPGSSNIAYSLGAVCFILGVIHIISACKKYKGHIKEVLNEFSESTLVYTFAILFGIVHIYSAITQRIQFGQYVAATTSTAFDSTKISSPAHFWGVVFGSIFALIILSVKCIKFKDKTSNI